jgi:cytochrome bd-type quinol oxidase subunit 2
MEKINKMGDMRMFSTAEKNYLINIILGVSGLACLVTGLLLKFKMPALMVYVNLKSLHEWTGYLVSTLVVLHLVMHLNWLQVLTKSMVQNKQKFVAAILALVFSVSLFLGLIALMPAGSKGTNPHKDFKRMPVTEKTN